MSAASAIDDPSNDVTVMVVDDTPANLRLLGDMLSAWGYRVQVFPRGRLALTAAERRPPDLVLLDIRMPDLSGFDVCRALKGNPATRDIPVIFTSALAEIHDKVQAFAVGGVDYVTKPFHYEEVRARVATHVRMRKLALELEVHSRDLQRLVSEQVSEIAESQLATIRALSRLAASRDDDTGSHIERVQDYCRVLVEDLRDRGGLADQIDDAFIPTLHHASTLHDIGKVGIPDSILLKQGGLSPAEREIMNTHTIIGARTLEAVRAEYPRNGIVNMGIEIARHHHERWDGSGYPDSLVGEAIPLSARVMAIVDIYDALRSKRPYKPAFDHERACEILLVGDGRVMPRHFDPRVLAAFGRCRDAFDGVFARHASEHVGAISRESSDIVLVA